MSNKPSDISSNQPSEAHELPALYLILDLDKSDSPLREVEAALEAAPIASLLIKKSSHKKPEKNLVAALQAHNIAVLLEDDETYKRVGADGCHLTPAHYDDLEDLVVRHGDEDIFGVLASPSRHEVMSLAEQGAAYMAIETEKERDARAQRSESEENQAPPTINWWVSLFEIPVVAWNLTSIEEALFATNEGADFLALAPSLWQNGPETTNQLKTLLTALSEAAFPEESA